MSIAPDDAEAGPASRGPLIRGVPMTGPAALNAAAVIVAALYFGRELLVPLVLALLLAFVLAPGVGLLQRARVPHAAAVLFTVLLAFAVIFGVGAVVGGQARQLATGLPRYETIIRDKLSSLAVGGAIVERLNGTLQNLVRGMAGAAPQPAAGDVPPAAGDVPPVAGDVPPAPTPVPPHAATPVATVPTLDGSSALVVVRSVVEPLLGPLATAGIVIVFLIFALLYREDLRDRLVRLLGRQDLHRTILAMNDAAQRLSRYFLFQLALNIGFGAFITGGLWLIGLPSPLLWGILAGTMRFVPFIGTFIALAPTVLLGMAAAPGWSLALSVLALFIISDLIVGQVVEPLLYGHSTGLSPMAVIVAAAFWTFLWGPIGLLLSTPLTVCLVVLGHHVEAMAFLEVMLSDRPPLQPEETFYQRALEGDARALLGQARAQLGVAPLAEYYDKVALRGLSLAQTDLSQDLLEFERLEAIHQQIASLLKAIATIDAAHGDDSASARPALDWAADGSVIVVPSRGQLDDLAADMTAQVLRGFGFGARVEANAVLGASRKTQTDLSAAKLCCLSVLDGGSTVSGVQYLLSRMRRAMPNALVVLGLWHGDRSRTLLPSLREAGVEETVVTSIQEILAFCKARMA